MKDKWQNMWTIYSKSACLISFHTWYNDGDGLVYFYLTDVSSCIHHTCCNGMFHSLDFYLVGDSSWILNYTPHMMKCHVAPCGILADVQTVYPTPDVRAGFMWWTPRWRCCWSGWDAGWGGSAGRRPGTRSGSTPPRSTTRSTPPRCSVASPPWYRRLAGSWECSGSGRRHGRWSSCRLALGAGGVSRWKENKRLTKLVKGSQARLENGEKRFWSNLALLKNEFLCWESCNKQCDDIPFTFNTISYSLINIIVDNQRLAKIVWSHKWRSTAHGLQNFTLMKFGYHWLRRRKETNNKRVFVKRFL